MARAVVYLRFPRNRNGFQDPPVVEWNARKEKELWNMLKRTNTDLEWNELARHFDVSLVYILQQAAWLYEKELGALRKRMSKISMSLAPGDSRLSTPTADAARKTPVLEETAPGTLFDDTFTTGSPSAEPDSFGGNLDLDERTVSDSGDFDTTAEFPSRRLLSTSRLLPSDYDDDDDFSESGLDSFLPSENRLDMSSSSSDSAVSQSALEAALMEQSNPSETSETL